ncbi:MAG: DUF6291 domain-containing protein [Lutibacter sp.]
MADNKKSFVLYADLLNVVEKLPDQIAGKLFKIILQYVNDKEVFTDDLLLEIAFEPIKLQLIRDLKKYKKSIETKSNSGALGNLKRWHEDLYQEVIEEKLSLKNAIEIAKGRSAINDIAKIPVNVTDNVTDNVTEINKKEKKEVFNFRKNLIDFGFKENLVEDWLKVRKTKKATNSKTAFNLFIEEVKKSNLNQDKILETCIEKDWKGFKSEWLVNISQNGKQKIAPVSEMNQTVMEKMKQYD